MVSYGSIGVEHEERLQRRKGNMPLPLPMLPVLLCAFAVTCLLLVVLPSRPSGAVMLNRMQVQPARVQMLCEGHFLDTATGVPEHSFSTPSHPGTLEGYEEPLPREIRAEIDSRYQLVTTSIHPFVLLANT